MSAPINKWVQKSQNAKMLEDISDIIMDVWSQDMTVGDLLNNLPDELKKAFLDMKFATTPIVDGVDQKIDLSLVAED